MTPQRAKAWIVVGVLVAVVGFLFIDNYAAGRGLLYNLTEGIVGFGGRRNQIIPYKFVLAAALVIVAVGVWHLWIGSKGPHDKDGPGRVDKDADRAGSESRSTGEKDNSHAHPASQAVYAVALIVGLLIVGTLTYEPGSSLTSILQAGTGVALIWFVISLVGMAIRAFRRPPSSG
jgi:hypothetical protein